jgi:hypothetical protein
MYVYFFYFQALFHETKQQRGDAQRVHSQGSSMGDHYASARFRTNWRTGETVTPAPQQPTPRQQPTPTMMAHMIGEIYVLISLMNFLPCEERNERC